MSSDLVDSLAKRLGASAALIQRSAQARASAQGTAADAVLAAWAGGSPPPTATPAPVVIDEPEPTSAAPESEPEPEDVAAEVPTQPTRPPELPDPAPVPADEPEPLPPGSLGALLVGALVLFAMMFVAAVVAPASGSNAETLDAVDPITLSAEATHGRDVYLAEGCAFCHTQQVRPVVTDADLGIVTLSESPFVPGISRRGPDLAHVGSRQPTDDAAWLTGYLEDPEAFRPDGDHASFGYLPDSNLKDLVAYLLESK